MRRVERSKPFIVWVTTRVSAASTMTSCVIVIDGAVSTVPPGTPPSELIAAIISRTSMETSRDGGSPALSFLAIAPAKKFRILRSFEVAMAWPSSDEIVTP